MTSRLFTLLLALCLALSLAACTRDGAPTSSAPVSGANTTVTTTTSTTTTTNENNVQSTANCVVLSPGNIYPKAFADYKATLRGFTDEMSIYQTFRDAEGDNHFRYINGAFEMMVNDQFFLLPVLPQNATLLSTHISTVGESEFSVVLPSGEDVRIIIRHRKNLPPNNTEGTPLKTFTNSHGITVSHYHHYIEYLDLHSGYYVWTVNDYYGWFHYNNEDYTVYEAFAKELGLEYVSLIHNE